MGLMHGAGILFYFCYRLDEKKEERQNATLVFPMLSASSGKAFSGACRSRPTLYRALHHTPVGRVLRSYALEPSRGIVRLLHMYCPSSTVKL